MSFSAANASPQEASLQEDALNADFPSQDSEVAKKMKAGSLTMILLAFQGASTEIAAGKTLGERWRLFTKLALFLLLEIVGIIRLIPYGVRAMWIYRSLPLVKSNLQRRATQEFLDLRWKLGTSTLPKDKGFGLGFGKRLREHGEEERQCAESMQHVDRLDEAEKGLSTVTTEATATDVSISTGGPDEDEGSQRESKQWRQGSGLFGGSQYQASVLRDIRYGVGARNTMDIYMPWTPVREGLVPVVLFVHGGVWASGEKWQYAPLGAELAHKGVISILMQYSLFPDVLAGEQAREVSQALLWVMNHVSDYGGDPSRIFLMGHSSGAHICAMALWERALARLQGRPGGSAMTMGGGGGSEIEGENGQSNLASSSSSLLSSVDEWERATRQPHCFIGLSGVYDVGVHYRYEQERGAAAVSALRRAMGGSEKFHHLSPALLFPTLKNYLPQFSSSTENTPTQPKPHPSQQSPASPPPSPHPPPQIPLPTNPHQKQNSIARHRHGNKLMRPGAAIAATSAALSSFIPTLESDTIVTGASSLLPQHSSSLKDNFPSDATTGLLAKRSLKTRREGTSSTTFPLLSKWFSEHVGETMEDVRRNLRAEGCGMEEIENNGAASESPRAGLGSGKSLGSSRGDEDLVAPSILMCSPGDIVVPPTTSYQLGRALAEIGCRAKVVSYDGVTHGDFIIWKKERRREGRGGPRGDSRRLGEHVEDIFEIVRESVLLDDLEWGI